MITIGADVHQGLHVAVALDQAGKELDRWRGANTAQGWRDILGWAQKLDRQRQWGIEGAWGFGRRLAQHLV
jgi:transposase